ncbi:MAG TPA: ABC transporter substrate-binding protein [Mycobacterium sp.]|uniref:ABC transporter substrate-binding protein n=1 Tax=Mycobacterium sp. TaxID=1785 RepID=UPI002D683B32|nr:ABC transporter substrate-binding protein [Mycobacterium sp.]HZU49908.1 ABC transporter substrate-binding protein [Mycobacterium sp.]
MKAGGPVTIGALTAQGAGDYERSLGFSGVATGDQAAMTKSVVGYINAHGGIAGHRVNLLIYDVKVADAYANASAAYQAACAYFTQDHHVFAVASYLSLLPASFYECLQQHHVPVDTPDEEFSASFLNRYAGTVILPSAPNYTRLMADSVDALWSSKWLTASSKVGVVAYDTPDGHSSVDAGLVPALKRHGLKLTDSFYTATDSSADSQYQDGVLRFKTDGVDRVFFAIGGEPAYFTLAAEQDAYHPRYELSSLEYPGVLEQDLPADQLVGAAGIGFDPYFDLDDAHWPTVHTPGEARCLSAMKAARQNLSTGTTMGIAAWICDDWFLFQTAFAQNHGVLTSGSLMDGVDRLGSRFASASTFATYFASGRPHDGSSAYRLVAFQSGCRCFMYQSGPRPLP